MLNLFTGRENIDKERFIYDCIKAHGGETLVLVPDQYTLVAEEQALKYLGTDCLFDVEILSMNRLGLRILQEQGTESVRMLDKYGRFMLLTLLIREHRDDFEIFSKSAGKLTFTSMLNDFISEFKQQDCTVEQLRGLLAGSGEHDGHDERDPILEAKIKELSGVIAAYEDAIKDRYTDSEDYISMYVSAIKDSHLVRGKSIWIYGYDSVTPKFAGAMIELARSAASVNFIVNQSDFGLDERLVYMLRQLAGEHDIETKEFGINDGISDSYVLPKSETIVRIEKYLWKDVLSPHEKALNSDFAPEDLTLVCAANPYYEAESAASYIWHLVRDLGYKMRDIQLIANDEGSMQPIIRRVFAEYGLPVFADSSRSISDSAAVSFIVNLLNFVRSRKASSYLFAMLKTGLSGFEDADIEELENYARDYRIKGSMWDKPFRYGRDAVGDERFAKLDSIREIISEKTEKLSELVKQAEAPAKAKNASSAKADTAGQSITAAEDSAGSAMMPETASSYNSREDHNAHTPALSGSANPAAAFIADFRKYLEDEWNLSERVEQAAIQQDDAGLHDEAQRMMQSYDAALELLDQIEEIMGGSALDLAEFTDIYASGISNVEVGVIPPSSDGLSMGTMIRTRPRRMRAAVILGANEGVMPLKPETEGLFSTDEKEFFKKKGFAPGSLDEIRMDEENAAMYRMMARPSEKIYISWSMTDAAGGDASPSPVIDSLMTLFQRIDRDGLIRRDIISEGWGSSLINTPEDSMRHLINHIKDGSGQEEKDALTRALISWYRDNLPEPLEVMLKAAAYDNDPAPLKRSTAKELFGRKDGSLVMSASSISSYIDCPFRFFIDRGLKPQEERAFASDSRSVGDVYHECLMTVARKIMRDRSLLERIRAAYADAEDAAVKASEASESSDIYESHGLEQSGSASDQQPSKNSGSDEDPLEELVAAALDEISEKYRGGLFISAGSENYRMSRIREICAAAAKAMASQLTAESVTGAEFETGFGRGRRFMPIQLRVDDEDVYVEGKIDRVDFIEVDGVIRSRIIDYKTGSDRLDLSKMRQGIRMQLMIYLISTTGDKEPAGMFYFNIKDPIESANDKSRSQVDTVVSRTPEDEFKLKGAFIDEEGVLSAMPEKALASSKGGMTREEYEEVRGDVLARIEETASGILSGKIGINPLKDNNRLVCSRCGNISICRRDRGYVKNYARSTGSKAGSKTGSKAESKTESET